MRFTGQIDKHKKTISYNVSTHSDYLSTYKNDKMIIDYLSDYHAYLPNVYMRKSFSPEVLYI
jgi:hypothetical protein